MMWGAGVVVEQKSAHVTSGQTEKRIGNRCHICNGCGRCLEEKSGIHVLTETGRKADRTETLTEEASLANDRGERLATVDIGTTTIAMQLYGVDGTVQDTFAMVNPQTVYGADVLSRIQAAENPADADRLKALVRDVLHQGIERFQTRIGETESLRMVIAANTTMVYLLMGWNTSELGKAPFHATHLQAAETVIDGVNCYIFPGLSAFVGGDIAAGIFACDMYESEEITLLLDLGTNGEMVLGNREKMIACSTAAGPAFEGGVNRGVWGADMISLLARLKRDGVLDETGLLADPYFEEGIRIGGVCVTQQAVRAVQLAKGAIFAGIKILAREYGITMEQIDRVVLAGGFGYYLSPQAAADIGLLPKELAEKCRTGGNTALAGALKLGRQMLLSEDGKTASAFPEETFHPQILNLAEAEGFQDIFIASMELV